MPPDLTFSLMNALFNVLMPLYSGKNVQKKICIQPLRQRLRLFLKKKCNFLDFKPLYEALRGNVEIHFWLGLDFQTTTFELQAYA